MVISFLLVAPFIHELISIYIPKNNNRYGIATKGTLIFCLSKLMVSLLRFLTNLYKSLILMLSDKHLIKTNAV